ncbi:MAG: type I restriction endonuclease [Truepera sp.]|nr:type I restriction endonuclease [Truepera sp.]
MITIITESDVEEATLEWLKGLIWTVAYGPNIVPDAPGAERIDYSKAVLIQCLCDSLARPNPNLPSAAWDSTFHKPAYPERSAFEARVGSGRVRGAQVKVVDNPVTSNWLAVNQFTVIENLPAAMSGTQAGKNNRWPDVVLFVSSLPLGVIEFANPADEAACSPKGDTCPG